MRDLGTSQGGNCTAKRKDKRDDRESCRWLILEKEKNQFHKSPSVTRTKRGEKRPGQFYRKKDQENPIRETDGKGRLTLTSNQLSWKRTKEQKKNRDDEEKKR